MPGARLWHARNEPQNVGLQAFVRVPLSDARRLDDSVLKSMGWIDRAGSIPRDRI